MLYLFLKHIIIGPWLRVLFRPWSEGMEQIPRRGAAIPEMAAPLRGSR